MMAEQGGSSRREGQRMWYQVSLYLSYRRNEASRYSQIFLHLQHLILENRHGVDCLFGMLSASASALTPVLQRIGYRWCGFGKNHGLHLTQKGPKHRLNQASSTNFTTFKIMLDVTEKYMSSCERDIVDGVGLSLVESEGLLQDITHVHLSNNR